MNLVLNDVNVLKTLTFCSVHDDVHTISGSLLPKLLHNIITDRPPYSDAVLDRGTLEAVFRLLLLRIFSFSVPSVSTMRMPDSGIQDQNFACPSVSPSRHSRFVTKRTNLLPIS